MQLYSKSLKINRIGLTATTISIMQRNFVFGGVAADATCLLLWWRLFGGVDATIYVSYPYPHSTHIIRI
jgi:hypothetical protein